MKKFTNMDLTPNLMAEFQKISKKISNKLSGEYGIIMHNMIKDGVHPTLIGITPLMILALTLASQVHLVTSAYIEDGNVNCSEEKTLDTIVMMANNFLGQYHSLKKGKIQ
jgi:hypothetical protein